MQRVPKSFVFLFLSLVLLGMSGCGTGGTGTGRCGNQIPAAKNLGIRAGDTIAITLANIPNGEQLTRQVDESGSVSLPILGRINVAGETEGTLARKIEKLYKDRDIYKLIDVSVAVSQRFVYVGGQVNLPGRIPYTPDLTLTKAIKSAGDFGTYARKRSVTLNRDKKSYTVDAEAALGDPRCDPPLEPGDSVTVNRSM